MSCCMYACSVKIECLEVPGRKSGGELHSVYGATVGCSAWSHPPHLFHACVACVGRHLGHWKAHSGGSTLLSWATLP